MKTKKLAVLQLLFVLFIVLFLVAGLAKAILFPTDISQYELRYNNKIPAFALPGYLDGSWQQGVDDALADQICFSTYYKKFYNELVSCLDSIFKPVRDAIGNRYVAYRDMYFFNGQLVYKADTASVDLSDYDKAFDVLNPLMQNLPQTEFFLYYVTSDIDIDFVSGESRGVFDYISGKADIPDENCAALSVASFEDYRENFFYSDHHWNHKGSYKAYLQLLELLGTEDTALSPTGERQLPGIFYGSKGIQIGSTLYYDKISVYDFDFPPMDYFLADSPLSDYGNTATDSEVISYGTVYGDDLGCLIFSTGMSDRENILIIGESYDNAVLKLLASHFNNTHSVDLRYYPYLTGKIFNLCDYVQQNNISKVLLIGSGEFYSQLLWMME